jgi:hypothetical protein
MKRSAKSKVFIVILNLLLLIVFTMTAWLYKDVANGTDPLALLVLYIVTFPALIVLGIILMVFKTRLHIPLFDTLIPFIGIVAFFIPLFANGINPSSYDWTGTGLIGFGMGVVLIIMTIITVVYSLVPKQNISPTGRHD